MNNLDKQYTELPQDIPEISFKLVEVTVKPRVIKLTVRGIFYVGVWGKIKTMWIWYWYYSDTESWFTYLDSPITYTRELPEDVAMYGDNVVVQAELRKTIPIENNESIR